MMRSLPNPRNLKEPQLVATLPLIPTPHLKRSPPTNHPSLTFLSPLDLPYPTATRCARAGSLEQNHLPRNLHYLKLPKNFLSLIKEAKRTTLPPIPFTINKLHYTPLTLHPLTAEA